MVIQGSISNPTHTYATSGTFSVELLLVNSCGDSVSTSFDVTVCPIVNLGFTSSASGSTFSFTATPAGLLNYQWSFGDGNTASKLTANNTYTTQGSFTVTVTAEDSCGNVFSYLDDVATCDVPAGDFSFNIVSTSANGMVVNFTASATGADEYHWYWGDGTNDKGTTPNAQHTYGVITLNYVVNLIPINDCGDSTVITRRLNEVGIYEESIPVNIYPNPTTSFVEVELPLATDAILSAFNAQGQIVVAERLVNATFKRVDLSDLPSGTYTVLVMMDNRPYYFSISKI